MEDNKQCKIKTPKYDIYEGKTEMDQLMRRIAQSQADAVWHGKYRASQPRNKKEAANPNYDPVLNRGSVYAHFRDDRNTPVDCLFHKGIRLCGGYNFSGQKDHFKDLEGKRTRWGVDFTERERMQINMALNGHLTSDTPEETQKEKEAAERKLKQYVDGRTESEKMAHRRQPTKEELALLAKYKKQIEDEKANPTLAPEYGGEFTLKHKLENNKIPTTRTAMQRTFARKSSKVRNFVSSRLKANAGGSSMARTTTNDYINTNTTVFLNTLVGSKMQDAAPMKNNNMKGHEFDLHCLGDRGINFQIVNNNEQAINMKNMDIDMDYTLVSKVIRNGVEYTKGERKNKAKLFNSDPGVIGLKFNKRKGDSHLNSFMACSALSLESQRANSALMGQCSNMNAKISDVHGINCERSINDSKPSLKQAAIKLHLLIRNLSLARSVKREQIRLEVTDQVINVRHMSRFDAINNFTKYGVIINADKLDKSEQELLPLMFGPGPACVLYSADKRRKSVYSKIQIESEDVLIFSEKESYTIKFNNWNCDLDELNKRVIMLFAKFNLLDDYSSTHSNLLGVFPTLGNMCGRRNVGLTINIGNSCLYYGMLTTDREAAIINPTPYTCSTQMVQLDAILSQINFNNMYSFGEVVGFWCRLGKNVYRREIVQTSKYGSIGIDNPFPQEIMHCPYQFYNLGAMVANFYQQEDPCGIVEPLLNYREGTPFVNTYIDTSRIAYIHSNNLERVLRDGGRYDPRAFYKGAAYFTGTGLAKSDTNVPLGVCHISNRNVPEEISEIRFTDKSAGAYQLESVLVCWDGKPVTYAKKGENKSYIHANPFLVFAVDEYDCCDPEDEVAITSFQYLKFKLDSYNNRQKKFGQNLNTDGSKDKDTKKPDDKEKEKPKDSDKKKDDDEKKPKDEKPKEKTEADTDEEIFAKLDSTTDTKIRQALFDKLSYAQQDKYVLRCYPDVPEAYSNLIINSKLVEYEEYMKNVHENYLKNLPTGNYHKNNYVNIDVIQKSGHQLDIIETPNLTYKNNSGGGRCGAIVLEAEFARNGESVSVEQIYKMLGLKDYTWLNDHEIAAVANHYGYNAVIYCHKPAELLVRPTQNVRYYGCEKAKGTLNIMHVNGNHYVQPFGHKEGGTVNWHYLRPERVTKHNLLYEIRVRARTGDQH